MNAVAVADSPVHRAVLSESDQKLLGFLAEGLPVEAVARRLDVSERTVRRRVRSLCDRIGVANPVQAVVWAVRGGLL